MKPFAVQFRVPDMWQQEAIRHLQAGRDVIVDAPTGAGKTYIFECYIEASPLRGQAIYTVPTRALANDKLNEWRRQGWNVGIATGDLAENLDAPVIVATLETQKARLVAGEGPKLLVIDEYQMLGDPLRGPNYELALAAAPPETQLLLMSGSVGNPDDTARWLRRLSRAVNVVRHTKRPVPLEEVHLQALPDNIPPQVRGFWPRAVARAMKAEMAPLLAFAPRRRAAEQLAFQLARMLPEDDPLELTPEQRQLAGYDLAKLLRARIAFHHSGLDYRQRAGLVEPLAKAGQLRVVVATMGLAAGINFSMRTVLVTDREYRVSDRAGMVRPDELLQMFGRAGRRGLDKRGYILVVPEKPRLNESKPLQLRRQGHLEWSSFLRVMSQAADAKLDPVVAAERLAGRLFTKEPVSLGLKRLRSNPPKQPEQANRVKTQSLREIQNPDGEWERKRAPQKALLADALIYYRGTWQPALQTPRSLEGITLGTLCKVGENGSTQYGREVPVASFGRVEEDGELVLTKSMARALRESRVWPEKEALPRRNWPLDRLEAEVVPKLPRLSYGGQCVQLEPRGETLYARLDFSRAMVYATPDKEGRALVNPPERERAVEVALRYELANAPERGRQFRPAEAWFALGLIDAKGYPTRRGVISSFFNHGEGLAIAAALEDPRYTLEELVYDIANLRAGHRFGVHEDVSSRLGNVCRTAYAGATYPGYLRKGVPETYGDGASEVMQRLDARPRDRHMLTAEELLLGDIERAQLEWRSLLNHVTHAPELDWDRWETFRALCRELYLSLPEPTTFEALPELTPMQRERHKSFLRFE